MKRIIIFSINILISLIFFSQNDNSSYPAFANRKYYEINENSDIKDYADIFNKTIKSYNHIIIKSGVYRLRAPIYLKSNILIEGVGKVVIIKDSSYSQVFTNKNAINDYTTVMDSIIMIKNITIDANNYGTQNDAVHPTANGNLSFKFFKKLVLKNIKIINGDSILYGVHFQSVKNVRVKNFLYQGKKDGVHINGGCENIIIDGFDISSFDDAFGIMTDDYPRVQHNTQDIRNIIIKNGISRKRKNQSGFFVRFMTGSWLDWYKGNKYKIGHVVNYKSKQYKKTNGDELISSYPPAHINGDEIYPDRIKWRYIGEGNNKTSNIYNIHISNVNLEDNRKIFRTINKDEYDYGEYPETENTSIVDSIFIDDYSLYVKNGKVGFYKEVHSKRDQKKILLIIYLIVSFIILIVIVIAYSNHRKKRLNNTYS